MNNYINDEKKGFKPSSKEEIEQLNLEENEVYEINMIYTCPFTNISEMINLKATVITVKIHGSAFEKCFIFTDAYANDGIVSFEKTKIISKVS